MQNNPYVAAIDRYFRIIVCTIAAVAGLGLAIWCVFSGHVPELGIRSTGPGYFADANPSQFWFTVVLFASFGVLFMHLAWRAYRA